MSWFSTAAAAKTQRDDLRKSALTSMHGAAEADRRLGAMIFLSTAALTTRGFEHGDRQYRSNQLGFR
jgi:hypothetical protein